MTVSEPSLDELNQLQQPLHDLHKQFITLVTPLRPDLYKYCLRLTNSPFEAEDLVQESLTRAFSRLSQIFQPLDLRRYIFRIATNVWIDQHRRARLINFEPLDEEILTLEPDGEPDGRVLEAMNMVVELLEPRQRVAVLLKDVFDFSLAEIAEFLETTPGAVKALLNRGRSRLAQSHQSHSPSRVDEDRLRLASLYVERLNARDWEGVEALLRADATESVQGVIEAYGRETIRVKILEGATQSLPDTFRAELIVLDGEPLVLWMWASDDGQVIIQDVERLWTDGQAITRLHSYYFCPDTVREVGRRLGRPSRPSGSYTT
jgi:RNA polymerase sigma-70 factor, ECF subfamily